MLESKPSWINEVEELTFEEAELLLKAGAFVQYDYILHPHVSEWLKEAPPYTAMRLSCYEDLCDCLSERPDGLVFFLTKHIEE